MKQYDLKDAIVRSFEEQEWRGKYFSNFRLPRRSGATTSLLRAAAQLSRSNKVIVSFFNKKFGEMTLKEMDLKDILHIVAVKNLVDELHRPLYHGEDTTYVFIDNLYHANLSQQDLGMLEELACIRNGTLRIINIDTGAE